MAKKAARGGIERKFITAILWVGVLPMGLALCLGFIFAMQGQRDAIQQTLAMTTQTIAGGFRSAMEARQSAAAHVADEPIVSEQLLALAAGEPLNGAALLRRLPRTPIDEEDIQTNYFLFDAQRELVFQSDPTVQAPPESADWMAHAKELEVEGFGYNAEKKRYVSYTLSPVRVAGMEEPLGYLLQAQGVKDLIDYVLGKTRLQEGESPDGNVYELVYLGSASEEYIVYLDGAPRYHTVDTNLASMLRANPGRIYGSAFLWSYASRGHTMPVMLSYHRLEPHTGLYFLAYRSMFDAVGAIVFAAATTFLVSATLIGVFCIIAYRFVNNNIIRPVSLLNEGAQIIRQGDLDLKLKINTEDEIEELAISFNKMALALRQYINRLEESEEKYRSLITAMRDGIYQSDNNGIITLVNPAAVDILGFDNAEQILGMSMRDLFLEEIDHARVTNELDRHGFIERTRVWFRKMDGKSLCVELAASRVFNELGIPIGVEGALRDVTQNLRLEQEARDRSERIAAINQIANVINSSLEAGRVYESIVVEVRKLFSFDYAAVALLNVDGEAFSTRQLWPEPPRGQEIALRLDGDRSCAAWVAREKRCLVVEKMDVDGREFISQFPHQIQSCLCVPLYATGRIIGTMNLGSRYRGAFSKHEVEVLEQMAPHLAVAIRNAELLEHLQHSLEEVTKAREKLHEVNEELKTLDEMKTNLLSNVSHELRTPLVSVMGYTDMILNGKVGPVNDTQAEYLGISLRNIEKLVTLIENLLDFSRLHRGDEDMVFDTFDLAECARSSMQIVRPVADAREIQLILNCPEEKVLVEGDKGKVGQVFNNLLSNAVKFNENGGKVQIDLNVTEENVEAVVSDTGIGIPEAALDKIFSRFYQVDSSSTRKYGGTGIGLAIAQDIMRLHGSRIYVSSKPGEGAVFRFSMPLSAPKRTAEDGTVSRALPMPTETHLLIELVTQDRALSAQVRQLLISEGMDVIHAAYPAVAVSLANKYSPDCILVDTEAGPLGSVVLDEILSDPSANAIPIVMLTNEESLYDRYRDIVAGRVRRGFRKSSLLSGIHSALSRGPESGEQLGNKVLCVDDDPEILTFITRCLEAEGFQTESCGSGEETLRRVATGEYWMVLLDIAMPGIDGWETCQRLRNLPGMGGLRIFMVTAKPMDRSLAKVKEAGATGYLMKPFKAEDLLALVENFEWRRAVADEA